MLQNAPRLIKFAIPSYNFVPFLKSCPLPRDGRGWKNYRENCDCKFRASKFRSISRGNSNCVSSSNTGTRTTRLHQPRKPWTVRMSTHGLRLVHFYPPFPFLSLTQEQSGELVYRNQQTTPRTVCLLRSDPPDIYIQERQSLRDREFLRESITTAQLLAWLNIRAQLLNSVNKRSYVKLEAPDSIGSAVLKIFLTEAF